MSERPGSRRPLLALLAAGALVLTITVPRGRGLADAPSRPVEVSGVRFAPIATVRGQRLELHNAALFRYRVLFRAYAAALYLAPGVSPREVLDDVPKRLELSYFWSIDGEDFGPAAMQILARMHTRATLARLAPRLDRLHGTYRDIEPGDRYALSYVPGRGTELSMNGRSLVVIPGADFARVYFSIWFGPDPLDDGLRDDLLARR